MPSAVRANRPLGQQSSPTVTGLDDGDTVGVANIGGEGGRGVGAAVEAGADVGGAGAVGSAAVGSAAAGGSPIISGSGVGEDGGTVRLRRCGADEAGDDADEADDADEEADEVADTAGGAGGAASTVGATAS